MKIKANVFRISVYGIIAILLLNAIPVQAAPAIFQGQDNQPPLPDAPSASEVTAADATPVVASALSIGHYHSCALTTDGNVKCWGYNEFGQLGNGLTGMANNSSTPVDVLVSVGGAALSGVTAVSAGVNHSCALMSDTGVKCWGKNFYGQLGDGTQTDSAVPVDAKVSAGGANLSGVTAVAAGYNHTCALMSDTTVKCWGDSEDGQLGNNTTGYINTSPQTVLNAAGTSSLTGVTNIFAGFNTNCALTTGGVPTCWGENNFGQLGNNTTTTDPNPLPVAVNGLTSNVQTISARGATCAKLTSGALKCWGPNGGGQLGNNTTTDSSVPVDVSGFTSNTSSMGAGSAHGCALNTDGVVKCWGSNDYGQLGNGTQTGPELVPINVTGMNSGVSSVGAGATFSCALMTDGSIKCWGSNSAGQLGNGIPLTGEDMSLTPVNVVGFGHLPTATTLTSPSSSLPVYSRPTFRWNASTYATHYYLLLKQGATVKLQGLYTATQTGCASGAGTCSLLSSLSLPAGSYTWQIHPYNYNGYGDWTSTMAFSTALTTGFDSQFTGNKTNWFASQGTWLNNTTYMYSNTLTAMTGAAGPHYQASTYFNYSYSTLDYQVRLLRTGCTTCATKLFIRGDGISAFPGWKNGYQFNIRRDGYYFVGKTVNGILTTLRPWTRSSFIKTYNNWNILRVTASGATLRFYANNSLVTTVIDSRFTTGKVGLGLYSNGTGGVNRLTVDYATLDLTP